MIIINRYMVNPAKNRNSNAIAVRSIKSRLGFPLLSKGLTMSIRNQLKPTNRPSSFKPLDLSSNFTSSIMSMPPPNICTRISFAAPLSRNSGFSSSGINPSAAPAFHSLTCCMCVIIIFLASIADKGIQWSNAQKKTYRHRKCLTCVKHFVYFLILFQRSSIGIVVPPLQDNSIYKSSGYSSHHDHYFLTLSHTHCCWCLL